MVAHLIVVRPMRALIVCGGVALMFAGCASATEPPSWVGAKTISGREAEALAIAVAEFHRHQGTRTDRGEPVYGDLRHYTVEFRSRHGILSATFAPELGPRDRKEGTVGGGTQYGIEVTYDVSLQSLKVVRTHWAR